MQIVTGRRGEPHVTSRQMQAVYRSFLGDFALLDIGEKLRAEAYSDDIVRVYDGVVSVQGIYAVIAYNQYDEVYIEPVSVGKKRIDTIVLHYTKDNALDVEDMQLDVVQGEEYTDNPIAPVVPEGGDAWEGTTDIQVPIYDVEVTNFGLTVTPYARMLNLIPTLESIAERIPETVVTGVKGDSEVLYRDGDVNITKANIGLGNVDNTADTDKPISTATQTALNLKADLTYVDAKISAAYHAGGSKTVAELTSALLIADNIGKVYNMSDSGVTTSDFVEGAGEPINEGDNVGICNVGTEESPVYKFDLLSGFVDLSAYYTKTESDNKYVAKETGKGLSTNDYTTADKNKLAGIEAEANKTVVDSFMSDSSTNPLQNKVITKELEGAKTTSGNPITVTDAAPVNAVNLSIDLEPIQDLHGYANPWVGGAGKNKWDEETIYGYRLVENGSYIRDTNELCSKNLIPVSPSTSYRFVRGGNSVITYNSNQEFISGFFVSAGEIFTTPSDCYYIHFNLGSSYGNVYNHDVGVIYPSSEMTYSPYSNICPISGRTEEVITQKDNPTNPTVTKTYTIQLGETVYGAQYDVTRGKMVVTHGEVDLGDLNWGYNAQYSLFYSSLSDGQKTGTGYGVSSALCSAYNVSTASHRDINNGDISVGNNVISSATCGVVIKDSRYTDASDFKTAVTGQQLVYPLATPFTIDLTPQQIKMLENTNTLSSDGNMALEYQPNNAIGEAVRVVEESYDAEFAVRPPLKKIAFSGTTDSDGSVTLINASDIPSNHRIIPLQITDMTIGGSAGTYFVEYKPYNSGDSVKGYCYTYFNGSQITPVGTVVTGNFYYYELEV